ncbi:hypothetical protein OVY01_22530 [Robbsia sp. Bb-Pol-6]|uniref:Uncharacterized protein n=1 Tax=Robbsia betulipollinis TaxID=2981849 RepID=A0ABT3ZTN9_9BURK|nr:hypothetical protein [Robbsia betulipollinis]MCY0389919.1 hypothetical protein [Robbsia betulipollinis]
MRNKTTTLVESSTTGSLVDISCLIPPGKSPTKGFVPEAFVSFDHWMSTIDSDSNPWDALTTNACAVPLNAEETAFEIKAVQA